MFDACATKRSKMGLIGITYKARIRPNEESYLVMNSDGSMEVANSGNIEPAKCE